MTSSILLGLLALASTFGVGGMVSAWVLKHLPTKVDVQPSHSAKLNSAVGALLQAALDVLRAELSTDVLNDLIKALATGNVDTFKKVLLGDVPDLLKKVQASAGTLVQAELELLLGKGEAANRVTQVVVGAAHDLVASHLDTQATAKQVVTLTQAKEVVTLADGIKLVKPAPVPSPA